MGAIHNSGSVRSKYEGPAPDIRQSLAQAVTYLSPHLSRIRTAWRKSLQRREPCGPYVAALSGLHLPQRFRELTSGDHRAYREECEHQGRDLAHQGVPVEC